MMLDIYYSAIGAPIGQATTKADYTGSASDDPHLSGSLIPEWGRGGVVDWSGGTHKY